MNATTPNQLAINALAKAQREMDSASKQLSDARALVKVLNDQYKVDKAIETKQQISAVKQSLFALMQAEIASKKRFDDVKVSVDLQLAL
jgi:hypothetical protein